MQDTHQPEPKDALLSELYNKYAASIQILLKFSVSRTVVFLKGLFLTSALRFTSLHSFCLIDHGY
jgi:hypothetical protein